MNDIVFISILALAGVGLMFNSNSALKSIKRKKEDDPESGQWLIPSFKLDFILGIIFILISLTYTFYILLPN